MKRLLIVLGIILFISCQKNEIDFTGDLVVKFRNPEYLSPSFLPEIYTTENSYYPLIENIKVDENGILKISDLNYGNYFIKYTKHFGNGSNYGYQKIFQIRAGNVTEMIIEL